MLTAAKRCDLYGELHLDHGVDIRILNPPRPTLGQEIYHITSAIHVDYARDLKHKMI
jgi:hypothetical protein